MRGSAGLFWLMVALQLLAAAAVVPAIRSLPANTIGLIHPEASASGAVARAAAGVRAEPPTT
jgi:hypothetical protein